MRRTVAHRFLANYQASLADANEVLALTEHDERLRAVHAEALRARGMSLYQLGQLSEAIDWLTRSLAAYNTLGEAQNAAMLLMELGMAYRAAGDYPSAEAAYQKALRHWRAERNLAWQANLLNNLAVLHHMEGNYEQAGAFLEEGLECARQSGYGRLEAFILASIGDLYIDLDAFESALMAYRQARETARRIDDRFVLFYLDLAEAAIARLKGDQAGAHDLLESAARLAEASGSRVERALHQLGVGRLALGQGQARAAVAHLAEASQHFDRGGQQVEAARAYLSLAVACQASGEERAALDHLGRAFQLASALESHHILVVAGREARELLEAAQGDPAVGLQANRLLGHVTQFEQSIPSLRRRLRRKVVTVSFVPPKLTIQALGRARVLVDGRAVTGTDWQAQGACDLFFCLLGHPDGLTKEAVGAIFWPDASPAQLRLKFKNTIYRLRHALEQDVILFEGERYRFNQALDYEYDVETFTRRLAQAAAARDPRERLAAYQAAIRLYKGAYLPQADGTWVWPERERLRQAHEDAILKAARLHLEAGESRAALDYCRRILTEDPCLEEAHRLAMRAYAAMGDRAAVARQFERCRQALRDEVGAPPSPQTEELYTILMH
ncbi:MAG TPA: hypothetical protein DEP84_20145 [Chloroflexi bacterium]|nr:hypothetical protein [Chloroflexota bacterium]